MTQGAKKWIDTAVCCVCVWAESINIGHRKTWRKCLAINVTLQPLFSKENTSLHTHTLCPLLCLESKESTTTTKIYIYIKNNSQDVFLSSLEQCPAPRRWKRNAFKSAYSHWLNSYCRDRRSGLCLMSATSGSASVLCLCIFTSALWEHTKLFCPTEGLRRTFMVHACVPHILNRNHMVGLALMICGWLV